MHIMKRGLNYLRNRGANKKDTQIPQAEHCPPPLPRNPAPHFLNSSFSSSRESLSSTGATLSSGDESPTSTTTDQETYSHFKRALNSQPYYMLPPRAPNRQQKFLRMSAMKKPCSQRRSELEPGLLPPPPPSPVQEGAWESNSSFYAESKRPSSRATLPRCSSRNSLEFMMEDGTGARPSSSHAPPEEELYSQIRKPRRPRKKVCFRDPLSLSSIQEVSPLSISANSANENCENMSPRKSFFSGFSSPNRFKSSAKPLPKTNPHFTLPRSFGTQLNRNQLEYSSSERVCSYYDSDDGSFSSYSTSAEGSRTRKRGRPGGASANMQRVLAGLKSFGIKVDECRNLIPPCSSAANSYVRLSLMPDKEKRTHCRTDLIPRTNSPIFNQTFTMKSALLGCMAFTVKHLVQASKEVDGWYFLLAPSFGRHKHLAVDKVNMLTYYGSVDSGLQGSSGTSLSSQVL